MGSVIKLGGSKTNENVIKLGSSKNKGWASIGSQLKKIEKLPTPIKVIASPKTTVALSSVLGGLLGGLGGIAKGAIVSSGAITGAGILSSSPTASKFVKDKFTKPAEVGEKIGGFIENVSKLPTTAKEKATNLTEKFKDFVSSPVGLLTTAGVGAGLAAAPFVASKIKGALTNKLTAEPVSMASEISPITRETVPLGAVSPSNQEVAQEAPTVAKVAQKPVSIKNTIKINNKSSVRRTKKYLNVNLIN